MKLQNQKFLCVAVIAIILSACGGGGGGTGSSGGASSTFRADSGVAQKGPLLLGSQVTAQELDASLIPTGKQYTYQVSSDLGSFSPTSTFTSAYIDVLATGYYFDEVLGKVSTGTVALNGLNVLSSDTVLNVNLLTTLAYQRVKKLMTVGGMTFLTARSQAENEVLAALGIREGNQYGNFGNLDLSKKRDGDNILAAISSLFVYGNTSGTMSSLIANFQSDIAANGVITSTATKTALSNAAKQIIPATVASNLTKKYSSLGISFLPTDISKWLDQDGDGVIGKFKFQAVQIPTATPYSFPAYIVGASDNGAVYGIANGQFSVNGSAQTNTATVATGDTIIVTRTPVAHDSTSAYLQSGNLKIARYAFSPLASAGSLGTITGFGLDTTVLNDGKVLVTGGGTTTAVLYDAATNLWTPSSTMAISRSGHTSTLLPNGKVLVIGGGSGAELYDPLADTWVTEFSTLITTTTTVTGTLVVTTTSIAAPFPYLADHTATLLKTGKVLVVGGGLSGPELYDPNTSIRTSAGWFENPAAPRSYHTATLLSDGKVLITGGYAGYLALADAQVFDPDLNTWTTVGSLAAASYFHTVTLLADGRMLIVGGRNEFGSTLNRSELFDPITNTWSAGRGLTTARSSHVTQLLNDGKILVAGGITLSGISSKGTEIYDPITNTWTVNMNMSYARSSFRAEKLNNGKILMVGGSTSSAAETFQ
jgi:hypothetical protein